LLLTCSLCAAVAFLSFFFQAEDGIRDRNVTGVQTCALPISSGYWSASTLVIAAVVVVLPWSTCPMVPMFTCGFERSNLAFATVCPPGLHCDYDSRSHVVDRCHGT